MSTISFNGLGSGLDITGIVTGLVDAQRVPYESRVTTQQGQITTEISAMGALKGSLQDVYTALEKLSDEDNFQQRKISGNDDFVSLSVDDDASTGSYDVAVDRLAEAHKLLTAATFASDEAIGEGTLEFSAGDSSFTIDVEADTTLSDLKKLINDDPDNKGLSASIITDASGQYLVLNANETGEDNAITIVATPVDPLDPDNRLDEFTFDPADVPGSALSQLNAATNAQITIDETITVSSNTNTFKDAIEGITITANDVHGTDEDSTISVREDNSAAKSALSSFVDSYNSFIDMSNSLGDGDLGGPLIGDSLLRGIMTSLRRELTSNYTTSDGTELSLVFVGVETDQYGKLSFDSSVFNDLADENPQALEEFFVGTGDEEGFASTMSNILNYYTQTNGLIDGRIESYNTQLDRMQNDYEAFSQRMDDLEARLFEQFNAMDALVASMNATSDYLQQQLDNLPGVVRDKD